MPANLENSAVATGLEKVSFHAAAAAKSLQSCPTLCDPRDDSPPGSPIPGILQARKQEWVSISFSITLIINMKFYQNCIVKALS